MLLQIAYILCFLRYYCQGQSSNEVLFTSNPIFETVTNPKTSTTTTTTTTTTTAAPVTVSELNLFTSNPIAPIDTNELPDVVPLLTNNTPSTDLPLFLSPENILPIIPLPLPIDPITLVDRTEAVTLEQPDQPITFRETDPPIFTIPEVTQPSIEPSPITFPEFTQPSTEPSPITFPETKQPYTEPPVTSPETKKPSTFVPTEQPTIVIEPAIEIGPSEETPSPTLPPTTVQQLIELALNNILPSTRRCGLQNERTSWFDGSIANLDEFPWVVLLKYHHNECYNAGFRCTGTLISRRYVLTAANCVVTHGEITGPKTAVLGEYKISSARDCFEHFYREECSDKIVEVPIEKHILHPKYLSSMNYQGNNLALLRLQSNIDFSRFIAPLCLPTPSLKPPTMGKILVTSGWGATENGVESDVKVRTDVPVLSDAQCAMKLYSEMYVFPNQVCIGTDFQKQICRADYGGPVMSADRAGKPQWYLEGIISGGFGFGRNGVPNIYTRIPPYVEWILSTMAQDTYNAI